MSNNLTITGNAGGDVDLRYTQGGAPVAGFSVGDTPRKFDRDRNEWVDAGDTLWLRVNAWHELGEWAAENVRKGSRVTITGRLKQRNWEDKDGGKRQSYEIDAESIAVHPPKVQRGQQGYSTPPQQQGDPWQTAASQQGQRYADGTPAPQEEIPF